MDDIPKQKEIYYFRLDDIIYRMIHQAQYSYPT